MDLLPAIEQLYAFAVDERELLPALEAVCEVLDSTGAVVCSADPQTGRIVSAQPTPGLPPKLTEDFLAYYAHKEVRLAPALRYPVGHAMIDSELIDVREMRRTEIHNDLLMPHDVPHLSALWLKKTPRRYASVSFQYDAQHGPVRADERERLARLSPHVVRAFEARQLLNGATQAQQLLLQVLETLPFGVCLLDGAGHVAVATSLAERELRRGFPLSYGHGRVHAADFEQDGKLQSAIQACVATASNLEAGATLVLHRSTLAPTPLTVLVLPLRQAQSQSLYSCLLLLLDPEVRVQARAQSLQRTLELTHAEALLATVLMEGVTLQNAALKLRRSYNTCKTQIKAIYAKTGCCTQSDLARKFLLLTIGHSIVMR